MKRNLFSIIMCLTFSNILIAQTTGSSEMFSIPDGLSNPNVQSVYQDRFGYIWIMTQDGLNRYDGSKIKIYRNNPDDPASISTNTVFSAVEDTSGYLWIGGNAIVIRYDYATESFKDFQVTGIPANDRYNQMISLFCDSKGRVWAGSSVGSVHRFNKESNIYDYIPTDGNETLSAAASSIWNITELKNGKILTADYKWGIFQYDESADKFFKFYLSENFSPEHIFRIQEEDDGNIWFMGENKVIRYNPNFYSYEELNQFQIQNPIYHLGYHKVSDEEYIIVSDPFGLIRFNPKTSKIIETIRTSIPPYWFVSDKFGIIWIAAKGGLIKYDPNRKPIQSKQIQIQENQDNRGSEIEYVSLDIRNKQTAWLLSSDNTLINYDLSTGKSNSFTLPDKFINPSRIDRFIQDRQGNFILGSSQSQGLLKFDVKSKNISQLSEADGLLNPGSNTRDFSFDQNNNLFISSVSGMFYINLINDTQFTLPTVTNRMYSPQMKVVIDDALRSSSDIALITKAQESKTYSIDFSINEETPVLFRCFGEGTTEIVAQQMYDYGILSQSDGNEVFKMTDFSKTFNAGGGLKNRLQYQVFILPKGNYNLKFLMDVGHSYGNFNVPMFVDSALYGVQIYAISEASYKKIELQLEKDLSAFVMPVGAVRDIEVSRKFSNSVYLSTQTQGLFRFNILDSSYTQYTFGDKEPGNQKNFLQSCYEDKTGNLWVSSAQGLIMLNPDNGKWRVFTEKDGLPSNNLLKTTEDNNGNLWILTLGGLSMFNKIDPVDKWGFVNYDTRDGLTGYSFNGDFVKTPGGEILFVVGDALHRFTPGKSNSIKPNIVLDDLKISDISIFSPDSPLHLGRSLMETKSINLSYDLNDLTFVFNVIHYSRPYKNKMYYKLEGFNKEWIESEIGNATFTNLEPGSYEFKVKGISADGIQNDKGASLKITITPPWWRTMFAYIVYFFVFAGLIFAIDRIQRRRVLIKERAANAIKEAELRMKLAESENERKSKELEEARSLQLSMLPKELPQLPHLDIAVYMQTATEVGGDYYDFHVGLDGTLTVVIGDATGHGMKAGTMVTTAKSLFNSYAPNPDILFTFHEITRCIKQMNFGKLSMCLTMAKINGDKLQLSTAGMPPSFIFRRDTRVVEEHLFKAMPLGTMDKFPYEIKDTTLKSGDTILLMSDGLPELKNAADEMYGYKRIRNGFEDVAEKSPEEIIGYLKNEGSTWVNDEAPDDDVTFVVIKVK